MPPPIRERPNRNKRETPRAKRKKIAPRAPEGFRISHRDETGENHIAISVGDGDSQVTLDEHGHRIDLDD